VPNETADPRALRRYRRLLLAHPGWHRRLHGDDLLTALLDAAAAGRRPASPTREAFTLILDGLRCRLRVHGVGARLLAAMLALIGAGTVAATAGWCVWQVSSSPWPTVDKAIALAAPVLPPEAPETIVRRDDPLGPWLADADSIPLTLLGSPELRPGGVRLGYPRPLGADAAATYEMATARLTADGWRTQRAHGRLVADRQGLRITLVHVDSGADTDEMIVAVRPSPPGPAYVLGMLGAGAGALLGWLISAAAIARGRHGSLSRRIEATAVAIIGVVVSLPACLLNLTALTGSDALTHDGASPPWAGYEVFLARPAAAIGAILLAAAYLIAPSKPAPRTTAMTLRAGAAGNPIS
jgi:hypothetical protein